MSEVKVLFMEGDVVRSLRGEVCGEDEVFIDIRRKAGVVRIGKRYIVKVDGTVGVEGMV